MNATKYAAVLERDWLQVLKVYLEKEAGHFRMTMLSGIKLSWRKGGCNPMGYVR